MGRSEYISHDISKAPKTLDIKGHHFVEHQVSVNDRLDGVKHITRYAFYGRRILTEDQIREMIDVAILRGELKPAA